METIKPKQVIKYPTNVPSTFHKHSWLQTVSIKNACKWNVENKSYQALFQRGLLELQVRNASIQESTETEKKKKKKISAHANANILHKNEYIKKKKKD